MQELPVDLTNEEWAILFDRKVKENPDLLCFVSPDPTIRLQQLDRFQREGRLIIRPLKPKIKKRYRVSDWEDWLIYFVQCRIAGIHMNYEDLAQEMYNPVDLRDKPYHVQTIKNKFAEIIQTFKIRD